MLTLYFLSSLELTKNALYSWPRPRAATGSAELGDKVIHNVGGYVSGAFVVAMCAGISSLVFLFVVGLGKYAVALAFVVAVLDVIPMIGATLGAIIVTRDRASRPTSRSASPARSSTSFTSRSRTT